MPRGKADCTLGDMPLRYDFTAIEILNRPPIRHQFRSPFTGRSDITGRPGSQNFYPELLRWEMTEFSGEGQTVLHGADPDSATRFYQSEGLNFRVPGQFELNKSILVQQPQATGGATTTEGNSMTDEVGTSTVVNTTDRRLNATADVIETANHAAGAVAVQVDFHMYKEAQQLTTIEGSALVETQGPTSVSGTDLKMRPGSRARTGNLSVTAGVPAEVIFTFAGANVDQILYLSIHDWTDPDNIKTVVATEWVYSSVDPASAVAHLVFTPVSGRTYRARIADNDLFDHVLVDKVEYGKVDGPATVTIIAFNETTQATVTSKQLQITSTATAKTGSVTFAGVAATNYRYKVRYDSGNQRPVVDKVVATVAAAANFTFDAMELGQGGRVWITGSRAGTDIQTFSYDFPNNDWDSQQALNAVATTAETVHAMAHTDQFEYALVSGTEVIRFTTAADTAHTAAIAEAVAIAVAQDRLFVLSVGTTNGVVVRTYPLDAGAPATALATLTVGTALPTSNTTLRQQMCGTPTGARFFINHSDVQSVVWEVDSSGTTLVARQVAVMDVGTKITAIEYSQGYTFLVGQVLAETGQTATSALWAIPPNGNVAERIGEFRDDIAQAPIYIQPYLNDLWVLQGAHIWRYSLRTGGLFHEYELSPITPGNAKALAVVRGHLFAMYSDEGIYVAGSVSTFRQSSVANGNSFTASIYDFDLPGVLKELHEIVVLTDAMPAATSLRVEIQKDQDGTWTTLGSSASGSQHSFDTTAAGITPTFQTLQVRVTPSSQTGANTPTVKGVIAKAWTAEEEQFINVVVRLDNEDSSDHIPGSQSAAHGKAARLRGLKATRAPVTFIDHLAGTDYRVRVEDLELQTDSDSGEGRAVVNLRVL